MFWAQLQYKYYGWILSNIHLRYDKKCWEMSFFKHICFQHENVAWHSRFRYTFFFFLKSVLWIHFLAKFRFARGMISKILDDFENLFVPIFMYQTSSVSRRALFFEIAIRIRIQGSTAYRGSLIPKIWKRKRRLSTWSKIFVLSLVEPWILDWITIQGSTAYRGRRTPKI